MGGCWCSQASRAFLPHLSVVQIIIRCVNGFFAGSREEGINVFLLHVRIGVKELTLNRREVTRRDEINADVGFVVAPRHSDHSQTSLK